MTDKTVTIGDKEVAIRETDDGFEAVEATPDHDLYLRAVSDGGRYGFEIPLVHADEFVLKKYSDHASGNYIAALWNTEYDESDMRSAGSNEIHKFDREIPDRFDGNAVVQDVSVVER